MSLKPLTGYIFFTWLFNWILLWSLGGGLTSEAQADQASGSIQKISRSASHSLTIRDARKGGEMPNFTSRLPNAEMKHLPQLARKDNISPSWTFKIGVILPLSGENKEIGQQFLNAIMIALFDINNADIMLLPVDSQGTAEGALRAAAQALEQGADVFIGPVFEYSVQSVSALAKSHGIPLIGFSSNRNVAGEGTFLLNFLPEQQIEEIISFAIDQGIERFAALIPNSPYGEVVEEAYEFYVGRYGGELTNIVRYSADFDSIERAVKEFVATTEINQNDAILVPEGGMMLISLVSHLALHDIDTDLVRLLGTGLWDDEVLKREPSLIKGWYAAPSRRNSMYFSRKFEQGLGKTPHKVVSLAYDAMLLASVLQHKRQKHKRLQHRRMSYLEMQQTISRAEGYMGINGLFRLRPDGLCQRGLTIYEISITGPKPIQLAPSSFEQIQYDNLSNFED